MHAVTSGAAQSLPSTDLWIGGHWCSPETGEYFDVLNPLDDGVIARAAKGTAKDIDRAVVAAHGAFQSFRNTTPRERELWLNRAADLLQRDKAEFVRILIDEVGSPIHKAEFEVKLSTDMLRAAAGMARQVTGKTIPSDTPGRLSMSVRSPVGVVAAITPFNVPLIKGVRLSANPIAIGNTVVLLPSEEAPQLAARLARLYEDAGVPSGVFNVVSGIGYEIGDTLTTHPLVEVVTFTGSSRVGAHIRELCGRHGKKVTLELGGKSPLVVLKDADLDKAVAGSIHSIFTYQGQVCMGASRIYVERPVFDEFLTRFKVAADALPMGDLEDHRTILGPIISERQRARVRTHIEDAVAKGATVVTGSRWEGNRCAPTILTGVTAEMTCHAEETFGPVTSVYPVDSYEDALTLANSTRYGLSAAIYTSNINHALQFARDVKSGMVHVNAPSLYDEPHVPFGGTGESGFGREGTEEDIAVMTEWKWVTVQL